MKPVAHIEPTQLDLSSVFADISKIRAINPQRFEMEQLTAIVLFEPGPDKQLIAGYKDVRHDEFWVRGHMPDYPLMPGVMICEAAAQLSAFYSTSVGINDGDFIGFGGMENVRFRGVVRPGDRLVLVAKATKLHRRQTIFNVQAFVGSNMVFHGDVIGMPMKSNPAGAEA